jgi:hypothetical protein
MGCCVDDNDDDNIKVMLCVKLKELATDERRNEDKVEENLQQQLCARKETATITINMERLFFFRSFWFNVYERRDEVEEKKTSFRYEMRHK